MVLTKGTIFYKTRLRRQAEKATTFDVWCGPYSFKWGFNADLTGWNIICLQKLADGKTAGHFQPHPTIYYTNGSSKPNYYPKPPLYASRLIEQARYDIDFPVLEPIDDKGEAMTLSLYAERPDKDDVTAQLTAAAYWGLIPKGFFGTVVHRETTTTDGQTVRIRLGDKILETAYATVERRYAAPVATTPVATDPSRVPSVTYPTLQAYVPQYGTTEGSSDAGKAEAWRLGTLHVKPETLRLTKEAVKKDMPLLSLQAVRGERLRIVNAPAALKGAFQFLDGDYVYEWTRMGYQPDGHTYIDRLLCGDGHISTSISNRRSRMCVPLTPLNPAGDFDMKEWDIAPRDASSWGNIFVIGYQPYETVADPDPSPATITVEFRIDSGSDTHAELRVGTLNAEGLFIGSERLYPPYDKDGVARIYLWDKVLEIRRQDKLFTGTLVDHINGLSPYYVRP